MAYTAVWDSAVVCRLICTPGLVWEGKLHIILMALGRHGKRSLQAADYIPTVLIIISSVWEPTDRRLVVIHYANFDLVRIGAVWPDTRAPVGHMEAADTFCVRGSRYYCRCRDCGRCRGCGGGYRGSRGRRGVIIPRWRRNKVRWGALIPIKALRVVALEKSRYTTGRRPDLSGL